MEKMPDQYFSIDPDLYSYVGKLPEQHFNVWSFSNSGDQFLILVKKIVKPGSQSGTYIFYLEENSEKNITLHSISYVGHYP